MAKTVVFLAAFAGLSSLDCFVHVGAVAGGGLKTSRWTGREEKTASSPELFPNCRSKLECAVRCRRFSHCAAFAFDRESRTCSLFPVQKPEASPGQSQTVYWNTDPLCEEAEVGNGTTSWRSTLTSLEGDITCNTDFMYTNVNTTLRCSDNGTWEPPIGQCLQYYMRNTTGFFGFRDKSLLAGQCVLRADQLPTPRTWNGTSGVLFWRFVLSSGSVTDRLSVKTDGDKNTLTKETIQPFPFRVGQPFNISIVLLSADHTYSLRYNGQEYTRRSSVQSLSKVVEAYMDGAVELDYLNIWCV